MSLGMWIREMIRRLFRQWWVLSLLGCQAAVPVTMAAPVIFYSDLDSAPANAYVTIWGKDFGSEPGSVLLAGSSVGDGNVLSWTNAMIEFRVPSGGGNGISVRSKGGEQSNELPFVVRSAGKIFFISARDGDNKFNGRAETAQGGKTGPWRDLWAVEKLGDGDIVYVREGVYDEILFSRARQPGPKPRRQNDRSTTHFQVRASLSGSAGAPVAVVAYPGEKPIIGGDEARAVYFEGGVKDFTLAKFRLAGRQIAIGMGQGRDFARIRIVGNVASGFESPFGTVTIASCSGCKVLGNHIFDSGIPRSKFSHLIYYTGFGTGEDLEIAWNLLHDQHGGRGIQLFGHTADDRLSGVNIHDNVVFNCALDGILIGASDGPVKGWISDAVIYNNLVYNVGGAGIRIANPGVEARILHNTLYDNRISLLVQSSKSAEVHNNIFSGNGTHIALGGPGSRPPRDAAQTSDRAPQGATPREGMEPREPREGMAARRNGNPRRPMQYEVGETTISYNGYEGGEGASREDKNPVTGRARFRDPQKGDFSLEPESAFRRAGRRLDPSPPGIAPSEGTAPDLGALGWVRHVETPVELEVPSGKAAEARGAAD